jgi:DNA-binding NarL/FixJ family response regulator
MERIRVLIVDDQHLIRDGIASLLALRSEIEVVGSAENGEIAVQKAVELAPEVILMDIRMPVMDGITAVTEIRAAGTPTQILMLTTFDDEEYIVKSLRAGANGYLMKDLPTEDLARAIVQVHNGTYQLAPGVMGTLLKQLHRTDDPAGSEASGNGAQAPAGGGRAAGPGGALSDPQSDPEMERLWLSFTVREREVLRLLGTGATNAEIAEKIHLSPGTVKNYVSEILTALDLRDRTQAALMAVRYGWDR